MFILHTDGGSRQNPGPSGFGWVLHHQTQIYAYGRGFLGHMDNNQAEYQALIHALEYMRSARLTGRVKIRLDSRLVIGHQSLGWTCNDELWDLSKHTQYLLRDIDFHMEWCPRLSNQAADQLVNLAIDRREAPVVVQLSGTGLKRFDPLANQLRSKHYASFPHDRHLTR